MRPIEALLPPTVNHRAPSDPDAISVGPEMPAPVKLEMTPSVVIRPMELLVLSVNHRAPSGPAAIPYGSLMLGSVQVETTPAALSPAAAGDRTIEAATDPA